MNIGDADFDFFIEFDIDYVEKQLLNFSELLAAHLCFRDHNL